MICANHPEQEASAYCRECGKALCQECQRPSGGVVYCQEHARVQAPAASTPYASTAPPPAAAAPPDSGASPGLAFLLGLIPGVGAIYNGQYAKGLVHVVVWGLLVSITSSHAADNLEPLFGMLIVAWFFYMAFEAFHTAKKRRMGEPVDEFSSLVPLKGRAAGLPVAPLVLIMLGSIFLLNNLEILRLSQLLRYWPVFLIVLGAYMLYVRLAGADAPQQGSPEVGHERQ